MPQPCWKTPSFKFLPKSFLIAKGRYSKRCSGLLPISGIASEKICGIMESKKNKAEVTYVLDR